MANGGHISCAYCTYNRLTSAIFDIFDVETSPFVLCRAFRKPKQSHGRARSDYPMLNDLLPGIAYGIDNNAIIAGNPRPVAKVSLVRKNSE
jgi:hypothetical protein